MSDSDFDFSPVAPPSAEVSTGTGYKDRKGQRKKIVVKAKRIKVLRLWSGLRLVFAKKDNFHSVRGEVFFRCPVCGRKSKKVFQKEMFIKYGMDKTGKSVTAEEVHAMLEESAKAVLCRTHFHEKCFAWANMSPELQTMDRMINEMGNTPATWTLIGEKIGWLPTAAAAHYAEHQKNIKIK